MEFMMRAISTETYFADFKDSLKNFTFLKEDQLKTIIPFESSFQDIFDTQLSLLVHKGINIDGVLSFMVTEGVDGFFMYQLRIINQSELEAAKCNKPVTTETVTLSPASSMDVVSNKEYAYLYMVQSNEINTRWKCPFIKTVQHHLQMTVTDIQDKIKL